MGPVRRRGAGAVQRGGADFATEGRNSWSRATASCKHVALRRNTQRLQWGSERPERVAVKLREAAQVLCVRGAGGGHECQQIVQQLRHNGSLRLVVALAERVRQTTEIRNSDRHAAVESAHGGP